MKRIITIIAMTACAAVLMSSCQKTPAEKKAGVPMTIQASVVAPTGTKTLYEYDTESKTLEGFWNSEESITVVSFDQRGITAVDTFTSTGEEGRSKAEFSGTWTGNAGDKVICLYPSVDTYAGNSIFDAVRVGSPTIYMRNLSTASGALQHDDTGSISDVDLMLGEVTLYVSKDGNDESGEFIAHELESLPYIHLFTETDTSPFLSQPVLIADTVPQTLRAVAEGQGFTILPYARVRKHLPENVIALRLVPSPELHFSAYYLRHVQRGEALNALLRYLLKNV